MNKDSLGDRMKANYEDRFRHLLPRRTNLILRIDGRAFHSFTSKCAKPFDEDLTVALDKATRECLEDFQGAKLAYAQSDEISFWLTDYDSLQTEQWFDGNIQKIVSVAASKFTAEFNRAYTIQGRIDMYDKPATFDCRAFIIPELAEVANYFLWRQQDAKRNSIQMVARANFSHKECHEKSCKDLLEVLDKVSPWRDYDDGFKYGRTLTKNGTESADRTWEQWLNELQKQIQ